MNVRLERFFNISSHIPLILGLIIIILSGGLWYVDFSLQRQNAFSRQENFALQTSNRIAQEIEEKIEIIDSILVSEWVDIQNQTELTQKSRFNDLIPLFFNFFDDYQSINWINSSGHVLWVYPVEANQEVINQSIVYFADGNFNEAFDKARKGETISVTNYIEFYQGGQGIAVYIPVQYNNDLVGYFNVLINVNPVIDTIVHEDDRFTDYSVVLTDNTSIIYSINNNDDISDRYLITKEVSFYGKIWNLDINLTPKIIQSISIFNEIYIIIIGVFFALFAGFSTQLLIRQNNIQKERFEEKENYQKLINRYEKMNALGTMAGGLAHDFNNLLMSIQGNVSILKLLLEQTDNDELEEIVITIEETIEKSKNLTQQIMIFSRHSEIESEPLDAIKILEDALNMFDSARDKQIEVNINLHHTDSLSLINYSRLSQSFLNILNNAQDAIENGGYIEINTYTISNPHNLPNTLQALDEEDPSYLCIEFIDSGKGISQQDLEQIFDPFYTTKELGKGTGLGLSIVYQYISSIGGEIQVRSELGFGTKFMVYIPVVSVPEEQSIDDKDVGILLQELGDRFHAKFNRNPSILLIEDEVEIAKSLKRILEFADIKVDMVHNGQDAMKFFDNGTYDIIVADINLPGRSGIDIAQEMRRKRPEQSLLFITGFNEDNIPPHQLSEFDLLHKPFNQQELLRIMNKKLNELSS